ncbi:MAG: prolyl aminopeptidase [Proteobacteria bacterium]|nr:prolyl aminopeptidase [Pseudomonadota bacterium]
MLYPQIKPNQSGFIQVSKIHNIYWEESGNPNGKPVVFVHGGPGGGVSADTRRFFDPDKYRIIQFDQRGCGKSTPNASVEENTTWDLIADMETIRELLNVDKWQVFGGSWGSTLALVYAIKHPNRVIELVLRGIFLLRKAELQWFYQFGASQIFADAWQAYRDFIPENERHDLMSAYQKRLFGEDKQQQLLAARHWSVWEGSTCHMIPDLKHIEETADDEFALAFSRIENHYFMNQGFFGSENDSENWILDNIDKIRHIPTVIIQGRYDVVCPMTTAYDLHRVFPESELIIVPEAGHSAFEPHIITELVKATDKFVE